MTTATSPRPKAPPGPPQSRNGGPSAPAPAPTRAAPTLRQPDDTGMAPPLLVVNAVEGWGKTTLVAHAEKPAILMARGERGYQTLYSHGLVPACDCVELQSWAETLAQLDDLATNPAGHKTVALDALSGFERLCHEAVCARDFGNDWGEKGFSSFQKGYDVSVAEWIKLLQRLDTLNQRHGMTIVLLSHSIVKPFKNPLGPDFDRYVADCHAKTWGVTAKWADAVLFGNFVTIVDKVQENKRGAKGKGIGGTDRVLYAERRDAFDAKNRFGITEDIEIPNDPTQTWATLWSAIHDRKEQTTNA